MRILAISDIHDNVEAVRRLRFIESNRFDAVVSAGDFGSSAITEIISILSSFDCPVLYVLGNWDLRVDYGTLYAPNVHHLHMAPFHVGGLSFIGYSGCDAAWGNNPIATAERQKLLGRHPSFIASKIFWGRLNPDLKLKKKQKEALHAEWREDFRKTYHAVAAANRDALSAISRTESLNLTRTVIVSHDRIFRVGEFFPGVPMHLFGHRHGFKDSSHNGVRCINMSALDARQVIECPAAFAKAKSRPTAVFDYGTYTAIEIDSRFEISAMSHRIYPDHPEVSYSGIGFSGRTDYAADPVGGAFIDPTAKFAKRIMSFHPLPVVRPGDPPRMIKETPVFA